MKKKLPVVVTKPTPAAAQRDLAVKTVAAGSRPEFPTRSDFYRTASLLGGATLLASCLSHTDAAPAKPEPAQPGASQPAVNPTEAAVAIAPPVAAVAIAPPAPPPVPEPLPPAPVPSVDRQQLENVVPMFKVHREGGGIGPAEDMWQESEVEAFINWTMAREGKLAIQTDYAFTFEGVSLKLDGFDPERNVGYEYVDKMEPDPDAVTAETRAAFERWMKAKKVAILFIETKRNPDAATIKGKILKFLNAVKKAPPAGGPLAAAGAEPVAPPAKK